MGIPLKTIALADDEPLVLHTLQHKAAGAGYTVVGTALNGVEAVSLVKLHKPHLILLDLHMPVMDGLEAIRQIAALGTTAVVMMTGDPDPLVARQAMDLGASGYMQKPFDSAQIMSIMESAWHRFQAMGVLEQKTKELNEALELRKLTEKAKGILMEQQGFSEAEAHRCLLKMSQDQGLLLKDVCRSVIQVRMVLGKSTKKTHPNKS